MRYILLLLITLPLMGDVVKHLTLTKTVTVKNHSTLLVKKLGKTIFFHDFKSEEAQMSVVKRGSNGYAVIVNRAAFYIYSTRLNNLLGPFKPKFRGEGADAQSGMIKHTFQYRDYFGGYCVDSGPFLFTLWKVEKPVEITPVKPGIYMLPKKKRFQTMLINNTHHYTHPRYRILPQKWEKRPMIEMVGNYAILHNKKERQIIDTLNNGAVYDSIIQKTKSLDQLKNYLIEKNKLGSAIEAYQLKGEQYDLWRKKIYQPWYDQNFRRCLKKHKIKMSCSGRSGSCERVVLHVVFDIDRDGVIKAYDVTKRFLCKHPKAMEKCLLKPLLKVKFPEKLRKMRLKTILGNGLKC